MFKQIINRILNSLRLRSAYLRDYLIKFLIIRIRHVEYNGISMMFHAPNSICEYRARSFAYKEPDTLSWLEDMPLNSVLWDIGANIGIYSVYAAIKSRARVFALEPSVFNLEFLSRNIFLNKLQGSVTILPVALSDKITPSLFKMSSLNWGGALSTFGESFDQHGNPLHSVFEYMTMGVTMDSLVSLFEIPAPSHIKIDVDGIEHFILRGGSEVLKNVKSVLIEIDDSFIEQAEESAKLLGAAGLTLLRKCNAGTGNQFNQWWVRNNI